MVEELLVAGIGACAAFLVWTLARGAARRRPASRTRAELEAALALCREYRLDEARARLERLGASSAQQAELACALAAEGRADAARRLLDDAGAAQTSAASVLYPALLAWLELEDEELARAAVRRLGAAEAAGSPVSSQVCLQAARLADELEEDHAAAALYARRIELRPDDLETCCEYAHFLLETERPDAAVPVLERAMSRLRRTFDRGDHWIHGAEPYEELQRVIGELHREAVGRSSYAEKAVEAHAALGLLDARAGVNYTLVGYSALVDRDRPRRGQLALLQVSDGVHWEEVTALLTRYRELGYVGSAYGLKNEHELFACGYERYAIRQALPEAPLDELHDCDRRFGLDAFFAPLRRRRGGCLVSPAESRDRFRGCLLGLAVGPRFEG